MDYEGSKECYGRCWPTVERAQVCSGTRETGEAPGVGGEQDRCRRSHRRSKGRLRVKVSGSVRER